MESESKFSAWLNRNYQTISDRLNEQVWFQQLKAKWEELDPQSRLYVKAGSAVAAGVGFLFIVISSIVSVNVLKRELAEKGDILTLIQSANEELRRLRSTNAGSRAADARTDWTEFFNTIADAAAVPRESLQIGSERAGSAGEMSKESLFDVTIKHVNVRQVMQYLYQLEQGAKPVKLRNLVVDTQDDPEGYMDATLSVSAFSLKPQE